MTVENVDELLFVIDQFVTPDTTEAEIGRYLEAANGLKLDGVNMTRVLNKLAEMSGRDVFKLRKKQQELRGEADWRTEITCLGDQTHEIADEILGILLAGGTA